MTAKKKKPRARVKALVVPVRDIADVLASRLAVEVIEARGVAAFMAMDWAKQSLGPDPTESELGELTSAIIEKYRKRYEASQSLVDRSRMAVKVMREVMSRGM